VFCCAGNNGAISGTTEYGRKKSLNYSCLALKEVFGESTGIIPAKAGMT
jgi:hypothetical protein